MKVEIISVSSRLLTSELPDVHAKHAANVMQALDFDLTCRVLVGEDVALVADVVRAGLERADAVLVIGNVSLVEGVLLPALARTTGRSLLPTAPGISDSQLLGTPGDANFGVFIRDERGLLFGLPDDRREMDVILEGKVLEALQEEARRDRVARMALLRTAGINKSSLQLRLQKLHLTPGESISYTSYAGQTDIRVRVEAETEALADGMLRRLVHEVQGQLGNDIYGRDDERLEDIIRDQLDGLGLSLMLAECNNGAKIGRRWQSTGSLPASRIVVMPRKDVEALSNLLDGLQTEDSSNLVDICNRVSAELRQSHKTDLTLLVYNNVNPGGIRVVVSLSSMHGVNSLERSFGGHPENIEDWAATLGLVQLWRWLRAHGAPKA